MADLIGRKLVVVGDTGVGKTCLLAVYAKGKFPTHSVPTTYDNYIMDLDVEGVAVELGLWDTPGNGDYDRLRPLIYTKSHVVLLCFSVDSPQSLVNAQTKWMPEVRHHRPDVPVILVGCKNDLRDRVASSGVDVSLVTAEEGKDVAEELGCNKYIQCSAKVEQGVVDLFEYAAKVSLIAKCKKPRGKRKECGIL